MKVVLTIAGSDSSGGAGIQADLKTFEAFGVFGTTAITVLTAQNTMGVQKIVPLDTSFIRTQVESIFQDFEVAAIKIGMLFNKEIIDMVAELIKDFNIPIVLDPVSISKTGAPLLEESAIAAMSSLFEHVTLITPNAHEAYAFFDYNYLDRTSIKKIQRSHTSVLVKHHVVELAEGKFSTDKLYFRNEERVFQTPLIQTSNLHGTGCSFSSAITANLALGHTLEHSITRAKKFISEALKNAPDIGHGPGPINHKKGENMSKLLKGLYVITDEYLTPDEQVHSYVQEALTAGANIVQYRNKTKTDDEVEEVCRALQAMCSQYNVPFIIDDRPHLATKIHADGLHIGKDDMPIEEARKIFPKGIIGVSCYGSIRKAKEAEAEGADYVAFGSFFASPTKPHSGVISMNVLHKAKDAVDIPICAIGGIEQTNIGEIAATQTDMISVVSAVFKGNVQENVSNLIKGMKI